MKKVIRPNFRQRSERQKAFEQELSHLLSERDLSSRLEFYRALRRNERRQQMKLFAWSLLGTIAVIMIAGLAGLAV